VNNIEASPEKALPDQTNLISKQAILKNLIRLLSSFNKYMEIMENNE